MGCVVFCVSQHHGLYERKKKILQNQIYCRVNLLFGKGLIPFYFWRFSLLGVVVVSLCNPLWGCISLVWRGQSLNLSSSPSSPTILPRGRGRGSLAFVSKNCKSWTRGSFFVQIHPPGANCSVPLPSGSTPHRSPWGIGHRIKHAVQGKNRDCSQSPRGFQPCLQMGFYFILFYFFSGVNFFFSPSKSPRNWRTGFSKHPINFFI